MRLEGFQYAGMGCVIRAGRQSVANQRRDAMANIGTHLFQRVLRETVRMKRIIDAASQIIQRIQQCSIQIKNHKLILFHGESGLLCFVSAIIPQVSVCTQELASAVRLW